MTEKYLEEKFKALEDRLAVLENKIEEKKNEINVGDVVRCKKLDNSKLIVTHIYHDAGKFDALDYNGHASIDMNLALWEKTGEHVELDFIKEK